MKTFTMLLCLMFGCGSGLADWKQTAGPEGAEVIALGVIGTRVYAGTQSAGLFYSDDGCNTWHWGNRIENKSFDVTSFARADSLLFGCGPNCLYKLRSSGQQWDTILFPQGSGFGGAVAINGQNIYIGGQSGHGVYRLKLGDTAWVYDGLAGRQIMNLYYGASAMWACTDSGLYKLTSGWHKVFGNGVFRCMAFWENTIFAGGGTVYSSENNGGSWVPLESGAAVDANSMVVADNRLFAGAWNGIFMSPLGGNVNWSKNVNGLEYWRVNTLAYDGTRVIAGTYGAVFISDAAGSGWARRQSGLINTNTFIYPKGDSLIARADPVGFASTTDGGDHWKQMSSGLDRYDHVKLGIWDLTFNNSAMYAGTEAGLYVSGNNGISWSEHSEGLPSQYVYAVALAGPYLFAASGSTVCRSSASNIFFELFNNGLADVRVNQIKTVADTDIWVATAESGIFRRGINGVKPWESLNGGLGSMNVICLAGDPALMFAGTEDGLYSSIDFGQNWLKNTDLPPCGIGGVSVKGDTVFIMSGSGMFYSKNRGKSFSGASGMDFFGGPSICLEKEYVFVGTTDDGVWRKPWSEIRTFHLACDSVIVQSPAGSADSLFIECDTSWTIQGSLLPYFSASRMSGKGDGYVVFTALQTNTAENDNIATFELRSVLGPMAGFSLKQKGKASGVTDPQKLSMKVYPNPSSGLVSVRCDQGLICGLVLFNVFGQELKNIEFAPTHETSIGLETTGVFFLQVRSTRGVGGVKIINTLTRN